MRSTLKVATVSPHHILGRLCERHALSIEVNGDHVPNYIAHRLGFVIRFRVNLDVSFFLVDVCKTHKRACKTLKLCSQHSGGSSGTLKEMRP